MTQDEIRDALRQMQSHCHLREDLYKQGVAEYESVSAREVLYTLGYEEIQADEVLDAIHKNGFNYCLDPRFPSRDIEDDSKPTPTPYFACVWGIDQLRSRLDCVHFYDW